VEIPGLFWYVPWRDIRVLYMRTVIGIA